MVHGSTEVHRVVKEAVNKIWKFGGKPSESGGKSGENCGKTEEIGEKGDTGPAEGFWSTQTGESIEDQSVRAQVNNLLSTISVHYE